MPEKDSELSKQREIVRLPDSELEVMQVIWHHDTPISTTQIGEIINRRRSLSVSALQTLLYRLMDKGFLSSEKREKSRWYVPLVDEESYLAQENKSVLERLNQSSVTRFVASLYRSRNITDEDLEELHRFIDEKRKGE